jgi:hypothetical protein
LAQRVALGQHQAIAQEARRGKVAESKESRVFDVGHQHGEGVTAGVLQARETFVGCELRAAALQYQQESREQRQSDDERNHELGQAEGACAESVHARLR